MSQRRNVHKPKTTVYDFGNVKSPIHAVYVNTQDTIKYAAKMWP